MFWQVLLSEIAIFTIISIFLNIDTFWRPWETSLLKTLGKGEITRNEQFLLFPVFSTRLENFLLFPSNLKLSSADFFNLDLSKILSSGNGLNAVIQILSAF